GGVESFEPAIVKTSQMPKSTRLDVAFGAGSVFERVDGAFFVLGVVACVRFGRAALERVPDFVVCFAAAGSRLPVRAAGSAGFGADAWALPASPSGATGGASGAAALGAGRRSAQPSVAAALPGSTPAGALCRCAPRSSHPSV